MSNNEASVMLSNDARATQLIEQFAQEILALNNGRRIPTDWAIRLKTALRPQKAKRGHFDAERYAAVAEAIVLADDKATGARTKHHNPGLTKNTIAKRTGVSRKTVDRCAKEIESLNERWELPPEGRKKAALLEGVSNAIWPEIVSDSDDAPAM